MLDLRRPHIMAVANQKGGVGKTTTAINLASAFRRRGLKSLVIDLDPQGNASTGLGVASHARENGTCELLLASCSLKEAARSTEHDGISLVPATTDLSSADIELLDHPRRSHVLRDILWGNVAADLDVDFVLIDCPPSLNLLTINAFVAAHSVLVPLQSEFFALEGLSQLMLTIREVRHAANPELRIAGVLLTMHDTRNRLSQQVEADARATLGDLVFRTVVPRNVRVSEAPSFAMPVIEYDPYSKGARAYLALAAELLDKHHAAVA